MLRKRHELAEKIRRLSMGYVSDSREKQYASQSSMDIKFETYNVDYILLKNESQPLRPLIFHQPTVVSEKIKKNNFITYVYKIPVIEDRHEKAIQRGVTYSSQRMKIRRKKKRSATFSRIEELLSKGKDILLLPDPSEESLVDLSESVRGTPVHDISHLSEDILQKIFWYFSLKERCTILSQVCRAWYYILKNPMFWRHLEFTGDKVPTKTIIYLVNNSPQLKILKLHAVPEASVILQELSRDKTELRELTVRYCKMNRIECIHVLLLIPTSFPNLEVLDLEGSEFQSSRFFTELCLLKNLKVLNVSANKYLHPRDLMTISINCRHLKSLKILGAPSDEKVREKLSDENFSFILKNLNASLTHLDTDMQQLGNAAYLAILQCKLLRNLSLTNCLFLTGDMFRKFHMLHGLKELTLTRAINLTSEDFENLFCDGNLCSIEHLNISGCWRIDEPGLAAITKALPHLKSLSLENCKCIREKDIKPILQCANLSSLNVAHTGIQPSVFPEIASNTTSLRSLTIDRSMFDEGPIAQAATLLPQLTFQVRE